ncbi:alpha/beta hydrolase [Streptacidiphilus sp. P02-A3a]|nr:alpha/beta hydrolase [Streptacidiphilus sp. P02-A3a]
MTGRTPLFACRADQRFSYCLYVPRDLDTTRPHPLVVTVHGTERDATGYRDAFAALADTHQCVILAPLFPAAIGDPEDIDNYKLIDYRGIRFDQLLLEMTAEAALRWPIATDSFFLHGFSGGGQFALRFLYLHPDRLAGASIGAPGRVTLLDPTAAWPQGTSDLPDRFGTEVRPDALSSVPVQLLIGELDNQPHPLTPLNRTESMLLLRDNLLAHGLAPVLDVVPGAAHDGDALVPAAAEFLARLLPRPGGPVPDRPGTAAP